MPTQPNIIIIMTDQQSADLRQSEGFPLDTMPFLDAFAQQGVDFGRAYTPMPACAPARVSMFTGRYPSATHVRTNHNIPDAYYAKDLLQMLKENGYTTALCGKNHSYLAPDDVDLWFELSHNGGKGDDRTETEKQFDAYLDNLHHMTATEPTPFPVEVQGPARSVSKSMEWIQSVKAENNNPFFLWLSFAEPHNPYQVPEPYFSLFPPETLPPTKTDASALADKSFKYQWLRRIWEQVIPDFENTIPRTRANYCGMLRLIDDQVARLMAFLDDHDLKDNTIILFLADHGDFVGEYGLIRKGPELPEVLCRVPMIFTGPGIQSTGRNDTAFVSIVDIFPTLCDAIGARVPAGVQGKSLWPMLTGEDYDPAIFESAYIEHGFGGQYYDDSDTLDPIEEGAMGVNPNRFDCLNTWTQAGTMRAVVKGDWKLLYDMDGNGQLYNLPGDPMEEQNLFGDPVYAAIQAEMLEALLAWTLKAQDPLPYPRRRYVFKV